MSLVSRVMKVDFPVLSISGYPRRIMCAKSASLTFEENPTAAFAEKYCAATENRSPAKPIPIRMNIFPTI